MSNSFISEPNLHFILPVVDKEGPNGDPHDVGYKSTKTNKFNITWVEYVDIDQVENGNNEEDLRTLPHHFLKCWLKRLM